MEKVTSRTFKSDLWRNPKRMHWTSEDLSFWFCINGNENTTLCGVYKIHLRELAFLSRTSEDATKALLKRFEEYGEIKYNLSTHELAIKSWIPDHHLANQNMVKSAIHTSMAIEDKTLLEFVDFASSVGSAMVRLEMDTSATWKETVGEPMPNGSGTDLVEGEGEGEVSQDSPQDYPERDLVLEKSPKPDEKTLVNSQIDSARALVAMGDSQFQTLLANIEATGKHRNKRFVLTPAASAKFVALANISQPTASRAWADFLKWKGSKFNIHQVCAEDLPEFLEKRLSQLGGVAKTCSLIDPKKSTTAGTSEPKLHAEEGPASDDEVLQFSESLRKHSKVRRA